MSSVALWTLGDSHLETNGSIHLAVKKKNNNNC